MIQFTDITFGQLMIPLPRTAKILGVMASEQKNQGRIYFDGEMNDFVMREMRICPPGENKILEGFHCVGHFPAYQNVFFVFIKEEKFFTVQKGRVEVDTMDSAGYELFANEDIVVPQGVPKAIKTGVWTHFHHDLMAIIKEKSGRALKDNWDVKAGLIDSDYHGPNCEPEFEWKVVIRCNSGPVTLKVGDKLAQFIVVEKAKFFASGIKINRLQRIGGFGSTGIK